VPVRVGQCVAWRGMSSRVARILMADEPCALSQHSNRTSRARALRTTPQACPESQPSVWVSNRSVEEAREDMSETRREAAESCRIRGRETREGMGQANSSGSESRRLTSDVGISGVSTRERGRGRATEAVSSGSQLEAPPADVWTAGRSNRRPRPGRSRLRAVTATNSSCRPLRSGSEFTADRGRAVESGEWRVESGEASQSASEARVAHH
jgi:hypothetical protein